MKRFVLILFSAFFIISADNSPQQKYILKYHKIAVSEMERTGVPASITLAQGILESSSGQSVLARESNNHFGIKCHNDWKGKRTFQDDDSSGECFRVYPAAEDSFRDHSDFLRYRDRYKFLFEYETTDYESWAKGLSKAGYATDPNYSSKLISLIRDYDLSRFDSSVSSLPDTPLGIERSSESMLEPVEEEDFSLSRQEFERNGVIFVYALAGESYISIARSYNLFLKEILSYNDIDAIRNLVPGEAVYLGRKKFRAAKGLDKYIVESAGESLWSISQRFGVRLSSICKLNGFSSSYIPSEGDTVLLR